MDFCEAVHASSVQHSADLGQKSDELIEDSGVVEALVVDRHNPNLNRTKHAVEINADGDAADFGGLGKQRLDIRAEVLKAAFVIY